MLRGNTRRWNEGEKGRVYRGKKMIFRTGGVRQKSKHFK